MTRQSGLAAWTAPAGGDSGAQRTQKHQASSRASSAKNKAGAGATAEVQPRNPGQAGMPSSGSTKANGKNSGGAEAGLWQIGAEKKRGAGTASWGATAAETMLAGTSSREEGGRTLSIGGNAGASGASCAADWPRSGLSEWGVLGAAEEIRRAMTETAVEDICAANSTPLDTANPLLQTRARLQPGALRCNDAY
eukprot:scaffold41283_cov18-Tisochrysis_lutea.AAC.2